MLHGKQKYNTAKAVHEQEAKRIANVARKTSHMLKMQKNFFINSYSM